MTVDPTSGSLFPSPDPRRGEGPDSVPFNTQWRASEQERSSDSSGSGFGAGLDPAARAEPSGSAPGSSATADGPRTGTRKRGRRRSSRGRGSSGPEAAAAKAETGEEKPREAESRDADEEGGARRRRPRRRRSSSKKAAGSRAGAERAERAEAEPDSEPDHETDHEPDHEPDHETDHEPDHEPTEAGERSEARDGDDPEAPRKRRRRGSRGGRRRRRKADSAVEIESIPGEDDDLQDDEEIGELPDDAELVEDGSEESGRKKRRKKGRRKGSKSQESGGRGRRSRRRSPDEDDDLDDDDVSHLPQDDPSSVILVNAVEPEETRVAVVSEGRILDLQMTVPKRHSYVSDIYRGRVVNIETAIGAAFVDFGQGRNGFLHASDVMPCYGDPDWSLDKLLTTPQLPEGDVAAEGEDEEDDEESEPKAKKERGAKSGRGRGRVRRQRLGIERLLKKGQMVVVQITKDAIGDKGPTLTTHVSIPGRYLVLMPSLERTGVSRKIDDERERRRLKRILSGLDIPEGMGVIVRTAGIGRTKTDIKRDLDYLLLAWEDFSKKLQRGRNPAPLYQESDVAIRTMRDLFNASTEKVVVDEEEVYQRMIAFTEKLMPEHVDRLQFHKGPRPLFHGYGVEQDFEKIFARRVELPSGGSIVIDQTEALVAIDVNSGRTREEGAEFEDIALKTNLEAVEEIARQIRLRDLGGIIVLDYIDMMRSSGRRAVERATRDALKRDRARSKIGRISQFGLLELTRQRLGPGLSKLVYETCSRCRGSGRQRNASSRAQAILRRLGAALTLKGFTSVEVRAHPEVIEYLQKTLAKEMERLEQESGRAIVLLAVPDQVEDSVLHYLRADGREVRPGGRRKR